MTRTWSGLTVALLSVTVSASFAAEGAQPTSAASKNQSQPRITSQVDVHPMAPLTDREEVEVSFAAGRILKHIAQARQAIGQKKNDAAASHIAQGLKLVAIIESVLPHAKVKAEIKSGDLVYTDEDDVTARYITLFDELERRDIISPVMQAKKEAEQKHSQGNASAPSRAPVPIAVSRADIAYSSAKLDIVSPRRRPSTRSKTWRWVNPKPPTRRSWQSSLTVSCSSMKKSKCRLRKSRITSNSPRPS